jgi:hypothetical protein
MGIEEKRLDGMGKKKSSPPPAKLDFFEHSQTWNELATKENLPQIRPALNETRRNKLTARVSELPDFWEEVTAAVQDRGEWAKSHRFPTFDQILEPRILQKLLEGNYSENGKPKVERVLGEDGIWRRK